MIIDDLRILQLDPGCHFRFYNSVFTASSEETRNISLNWNEGEIPMLWDEELEREDIKITKPFTDSNQEEEKIRQRQYIETGKVYKKKFVRNVKKGRRDN